MFVKAGAEGAEMEPPVKRGYFDDSGASLLENRLICEPGFIDPAIEDGRSKFLVKINGDLGVIMP